MNPQRPLHETVVLIRDAIITDVSAIHALAVTSNLAAQWSRQQYEQIISRDVVESNANCGSVRRKVLVASRDATILGFLVARGVQNEWEIENILVSKNERRKGLGGRLFEKLRESVAQSGPGTIFLEVRQSNLPARSLYEKCGFQRTGERSGYYQNPEETAVLYRATFE